MTQRGFQHVLPRHEGWAVKREGSKRASRVLPDKRQALAYARNVARNEDSGVFIHRLDGTVQGSSSDPRGSKMPRKTLQTKERVHVTPDDGGWAVRSEHRKQAARRFDSKYAAVRYAHRLADKHKSAMVVHAADGKIDHIDIPPHYRSPLSAVMHARWR